MKCPSCGAEMTGEVCEYCGTRTRRENTRMNQNGCPKCGSTNVRYSLERSTWITQETHGFCRDCGYNWVKGDNSFSSFGTETILWIVGWLMCFPIPLSVLILRAKSIPPVVRYILIAALWLCTAGVFLFPFIQMLFFF